MFSKVLNLHNPIDKRSHGILKFFAENLTDIEKINFIELIFSKGSWTLPTEISNLSESVILKKDTQDKFLEIFNLWVTERVEHSTLLSKNIRTPFLPFQYKAELREAILAIRNVHFSNDLMSVFERFINECNTLLLKQYLDDSFRLVIEEFNVYELEKFFDYFLNIYIKNNSENIGYFIYHFLNILAYSPKIFNLSSDFVSKLIRVSSFFTRDNYQANYHLLISILLIEFIEKKKLDLSNSKFNGLLNKTITDLEKGNRENLELFRFLKRFNYQFKNYDFSADINTLIDGVDQNVIRAKTLNNTDKKPILHHYIKSAEEYFELFLFYIENNSNGLTKEYIIKFITKIDELRCSFSSLLWFDEYLCFQEIQGRVYEALKGGFNVKINEEFFLKKIKEKNIQDNCTPEFLSQNAYGFLSNWSLVDYPDSKKTFKSLFKKTYSIKKKIEIINNSSLGELDKFIVSKINYSGTNQGRVISLTPLNESLNDEISRFQLKSLFSSIELYLIERAYEYLDLSSPFRNSSFFIKNLVPSSLIQNYEIGLTEEMFWEILKNIRPILYQEIYLNFKKEEVLFKLLVEAYENENVIKGLIKSRTKGGMFVEILDWDAFLPGSQIDVKSIKNYDSYIGKTMDFKIIQLNLEFKNVVVSHKAVIEGDFEIKKKEIINKLEKGQVLEGVIKNITSYGVFVDLGGVDGLIHITDLSWFRINHPSDIVELDQVLKVIVLDFDDDKTRIQLGLKQLSIQPWDTLDDTIKVGDKVKGEVVLVADYGVFIDVAQGVEGLIHVSEMSWSTHLRSAQDFVKVGDKVEAQVLTLDRENRKMSLGIKQLHPDPWDAITEKYPAGSIHEGTVRNYTNFGVFVELEEGIDGLVYISDLSWTKKIKHPSDFVSVGDKLAVQVLELNVEGRKLNLGHKQTTLNPWSNIVQKYPVGSTHIGIVCNCTKFGIFIELEKGVVGSINKSELSKGDKIKSRSGNISKGDKIEVEILDMNIENGRLRLGRKKLYLNSNIKFEDVYFVDSIHTGVIKNLKGKGIILEFKGGIEGYTSFTKLRGSDDLNICVGERIECRIVRSTERNKRLLVQPLL